MAAADILVTDEYIDVHPYTTKDQQLGYMVMLSTSHYPPEDAPTWDADLSLSAGEKALEAWYLDDVDGSGGSSTINNYYATTGEAVRYLDFFDSWANELSFQSGRYDIGIGFITFDLSGISQYGPFSGAAFVAGLGTAYNDSGVKLHGHWIPRTEYQSDYFNWNSAYTSSPSGGIWKPVTLDSLVANEFQNAQGLDELPLYQIPSGGLKHLRFALSYSGTPTDFNGITIVPDYDAVDALTNDSTDLEVRSAYQDLPKIRFYRTTGVSVRGDFSFNVNLEIDATIRAEPLFHSARRRRNYLRR